MLVIANAIASDWLHAGMRAANHERYDKAESICGVRSQVRSKFLSRVRDVEQRVRTASGSRSRDRNSGPSERRMRAPCISVRGSTRQLLGCGGKRALTQQKRVRHLVLYIFKHAPW